METKTIPLRREADPADCWDLSKLYKSFEEWNTAFEAWKTRLPALTAFEGRLGESAAVLADFLEAESAWSMEEERLAWKTAKRRSAVSDWRLLRQKRAPV